jgi:hypothetical protein
LEKYVDRVATRVVVLSSVNSLAKTDESAAKNPDKTANGIKEEPIGMMIKINRKGKKTRR